MSANRSSAAKQQAAFSVKCQSFVGFALVIVLLSWGKFDVFADQVYQ